MKLHYTCDCGLILGYKKNCGYFSCPGCLLLLGSFDYDNGEEDKVEVIGIARREDSVRNHNLWKGNKYACH